MSAQFVAMAPRSASCASCGAARTHCSGMSMPCSQAGCATALPDRYCSMFSPPLRAAVRAGLQRSQAWPS